MSADEEIPWTKEAVKLPYSQHSATGPYFELDKSSLASSSPYVFEMHFNNILQT
jgi:hypothetical protein